MFVGRKNELDQFERLYDGGAFQCVVIYGRRRIGKTTLINEFIKGKKAIFFTASETSGEENLKNLSQSIYDFSHNDGVAPVYPDFQSALDTLYELGKTERVVFVVDEYPYLANSYKGISSLFQTQIDKKYLNSKLFIILSGSSMSFMENQVLGYKSPLYGRRTAQFKLLPFDFFDAANYFKGFSPYDAALLYGITGGIPQYLAQIKANLSVAENIKQNFLTPSAYLFEEPLNLLKQEVREPAGYNSIIKAIATGSSKNSEITSKVNLDSGACTVYLNNLISLGIVKKETPFAEDSARKTIYSLADGMFRFWYRFIPDNVSLIQNGMIERAYSKIEPHLNDFMGGVFEEICKQWLWRKNRKGALPIEFTDLGRWWGNNPHKREEAELDILAADGKTAALFAECKWKNENIDVTVLDTLIERSKLFSYPKICFYIFAKNGFTKSCIEKAKDMGNVTLVCFEDMINI